LAHGLNVRPAAALTAIGLALAAAGAAAAAPTVHASADDCAVMVEVGRHALDWGAKAPAYDLFADTPIDGGGTYLADCAWTKLGLAPPTAGSPASTKGFAFFRPTYDAGRTHASVELQTTMRAASMPPYLSVQVCSAAKTGGRWTFTGCRTTAVT